MIQTVTGALSEIDFCNILAHEHISCASPSFNIAFRDGWLDKDKLKKLSVETLKLLKEKLNVGLFVDGTPIDLKRDAELLKEISELSGVKIVASTGFYCFPSPEFYNNTPSDLAYWFINECKNGIYGTDIKPGILKCATNVSGLTEDNSKKLATMAIVQKETGLPLYVHCEHHGDIAHRQLDLLLENGADVNKVIIGHTALRPDKEYLEKILMRGAHICMDQCFCCGYNMEIIADSLITLCKKGYADKILISNDYCIHNDFCPTDRNGLHLSADEHLRTYSHIFTEVYEKFIALGGKESDWQMILTKNPVKILDN